MKNFLLALLLFPLSVMAMDIEVSVGHTQFGKTENGIWYQNGFDHTLDLKSNSYSIGLTGYATNWMRWRAAWVHLGNVSTNAQGVADANYNGVDGCIGPCPNINTYRTESSLRGLSLTVAPEKHLFWGVVGFFEAGLFYNLTKFYIASSACPGCAEVWENEYREGWNWGTQIGGGIDYKGAQIVLTIYKAAAPTNDPNAIINRTDLVGNLAYRQRF